MSKVNRNLDYLSYLNIWDALFYERIHKHGYPQELPFLPDGTVNHNTWAFMPLQSVLSGGVSNVFGIDYRLASVLVTLVAGCALSLVLYRLFVGSLNWSARGVFDTRPRAGGRIPQPPGAVGPGRVRPEPRKPNLCHRLR